MVLVMMMKKKKNFLLVGGGRGGLGGINAKLIHNANKSDEKCFLPLHCVKKKYGKRFYRRM